MRCQPPLFLPLVAMALASLTPGFLHAQSNDPELQSVLDLYLESMGGRAALENIQSLRLSGKVNLRDGTVYSITVLKKRPNLVRFVVEMPQMRVVQGYNGSEAWVLRQSGRNRIIERMNPESAVRFIRNAPIENVLLNPGETGVEIRLAGQAEVNRIPCHEIVATFPDGTRSVYFFEQANGRERKLVMYDAEGEVIEEIVPGRFEQIQGVVFARQQLYRRANETDSTLVFEDIEINIGIIDTIFNPPEPLPAE